jgi:hypothetical protein
MGSHGGPKIATDGLVFLMDTANKKSYTGSGTGFTGLSGKDDNGTLTNGTTRAPTSSGPIRPTSHGGSLVFDGANDYIQLPTQTIVGDFTLNLWINPSKITSPFSTILGNSASGGHYILLYKDGRIRVRLGSVSPYFVGGIPHHEWSLLTIKRTGTTANVYFNTVESSTGGTYVNSVNFVFNRIGSYSSITTNYMLNGKLANMSIYNRALTATELEKYYNETQNKFKNTPPNIKILSLDASNTQSYPGSGTTWTDLSGLKNNGTLNNGVAYNSGNSGYFDLDGSNDYISFSEYIPINNQSTTISVWMLSSGNQYSFFGDSASSSYVQIIDKRVIINHYGGLNGTHSFETNHPTTSWMNITWRWSNGTFRCFRNGVDSDTGSISKTTQEVDSFNQIGRRQTGSRYMNVNLGQFEIWNYGLSDSDITDFYNATKSRFGL